jgi:PERQ amino acid-rich with GYF domain-containing protein
MTTTTMHFGPEWMRPKHPLRPQNPPSPPPNAHVPSGASSYSALLTPSLQSTQESSDSPNPFLYSKEDLLKFYKDGGGRGGLGLEVERWEGVVREVGSEPVALKEWTEGERKVLLTSTHAVVTLNSWPPALRRFDQFRGASASAKRLPITACDPTRRKAETISC